MFSEPKKLEGRWFKIGKPSILLPKAICIKMSMPTTREKKAHEIKNIFILKSFFSKSLTITKKKIKNLKKKKDLIICVPYRSLTFKLGKFLIKVINIR